MPMDDWAPYGALRRGTWTHDAAHSPYGAWQPQFYDVDTNSTTGHEFINETLFELLNSVGTRERDVYEFGVYTASRMAQFARRLNGFGHLWGFDSFVGFPDEAAGVMSPSLWVSGRDSASDAMRLHSTRELLTALRHRIGRANTTFIVGFYNESLTPALAAHYSFQPALLVDLDCDLYLSTVQALRWLLDNRILVRGSYLRWANATRYTTGNGPLHLHVSRSCSACR